MYLQIKEALRSAILAGVYQPLQRLPSESQLMQTYCVSRMTIRHALRDLHNEGLIFSAQGKGVFVTRPGASHSVGRRLDDFGQILAGRGEEVHTEVLRVARVAADQVLPERLVGHTDDEGEVVRIERLRYLAREPVGYEWIHLPLALEKVLVGRDLAGDIRQILDNVFRSSISASRVKIEAVPGTPDTELHLGLPKTEPVLRVLRTTMGADGLPILVDHLWLHGKTFAYEFTVEHHIDGAA